MKKFNDFFRKIKSNENIIKKSILNEINSIKDLNKKENLKKIIIFLIIAEDKRFYNHPGFDIIAIFRAIRNNLFYNKREGARTIEQQLIRVLTNEYEKTFDRKIREILLAIKLKQFITKDEIAVLYLKKAYYGTNLNGLNQILLKYKLNLNDNLSDEICAEIISRLKYPEPSNSNSNKHLLINKRKNYLLKLYNKRYL